MSIELYQEKSTPLLYAYVNSAQSLKTVADLSATNVCDVFKEPLHNLHHSLDRSTQYFM